MTHLASTSSSTARGRTKTLFASLLACASAAAFAPCPGAHAAQTSVVSLVHTFGSAGGDTDFHGLIKATDGNFYGATSEGGPTDAGVIYKLTPAGVYSVLHAFEDDKSVLPEKTEGNTPGPIIQGKDGNLYGVCLGGGKNPNTPDGGGTFFKCTLGGVYTKLYDFDRGGGNSDNFPVAFVQGSDGNFYGLTREGGRTGLGDGAYFRLTPAGVFTELFAFNSNHGGVGYSPMAQLCVGKDGNFYGVTSAGATSAAGVPGSGAIFKATIAGKVTLLHAFLGESDEPNSPPDGGQYGLIQGLDGNLYGTSTEGGPQDFGTVYQCTLAGKLTILHNFTSGGDGKEPAGELVQGSDGNFYGGTRAGFPKQVEMDGPGGLFQVTPAGVFTTIHKFSNTSTTGPSQSFGHLVEVTKGVFYSVTAGGSNGLGTIIKTTVSPGITSAKTATATVGEPFTYQIKATNGPTGYGVLGLAKGLTLNKTSGLISGAPQTAGAKNMTLQAVNAGGTTTAPLTLTVKAQ